MTSTTTIAPQTDIRELFEVGAHFGFARGRRHPTVAPYLFGNKEGTDIFDLEKTAQCLETARAYAASLAQAGKQLLIVGGKNEVLSIAHSNAERIGMPYVAGRWIGGTLTNFKIVRKRIDLLEKLMTERDSGELAKYTKKERLLIDRQIEELLMRFGGLLSMKDLPDALFVIDTRYENTAVREANQLHIPIIGLAGSDCDFSLIQYAIPCNDTSVRSVRFIVEQIADAYASGKRAPEAV
jgi:small subunit ribosomal protein S2